jgi:hypothetical protein
MNTDERGCRNGYDYDNGFNVFAVATHSLAVEHRSTLAVRRRMVFGAARNDERCSAKRRMLHRETTSAGRCPAAKQD